MRATTRIQKTVMVWWYFSGWPASSALPRRMAAIRSVAASIDGDSVRTSRASRRWAAWLNALTIVTISEYSISVKYFALARPLPRVGTEVVALRRVIQVRDAHAGLVDHLRDPRHLLELDLRHF